ncbi:hypothetical protein GCM10010345_92350 [Streptomyces canarius]|uniref:Uncharacterized protein n=1 Tax=Streptomyces canarius TaxID=285453 RepID=A0ABQ3DC27_9ACTN|nr:hypothetical protein GCM10010345_92350 [Streptomyces canarius]
MDQFQVAHDRMPEPFDAFVVDVHVVRTPTSYGRREGEVAAGFGKQVPAVEVAAAVHHEHCRGDVDGRQGDVDHGGGDTGGSP